MDTEQFYPTPKELLEKIFKDTDWRTVPHIPYKYIFFC